MASPFECFCQFLSTTPWAGKGELYQMFSCEVDYEKTFALASHHYESQQAYMEQHLAPHSITFPHCPNNRWVPVELLKYIHNHDRPYIQRLERFIKICVPAGAYCTYSKQEVKKVRKGNVGTSFLSWMATFAFLLSDEESDEEVQMPALQLEGYMRDDKDVKALKTLADAEAELTTQSYPEGVKSAVEEPSGVEEEAAGASSPNKDDTGVLPEIELNLLSTIVIENEEFVFVHDLEKAMQLRLDEILGMICTFVDAGVDTNVDPYLEKIILPLGDTIAETVALVKDMVVDPAEQANVSEEEYKATQERLEANKATPLSALVDHSDVPEKSSIDLSATTTLAQEDIEQERVIEIDTFAGRGGGSREQSGLHGHDAALAHYLGRLPMDAIAIVHRDYSPQSLYNIYFLKALSKVLCVASMANTTKCIILLKKSLAIDIFGCGFRGKLLARIGIAKSLGKEDPQEIAQSLLEYTIPDNKRRRLNLVRKLL